MPDCTVRRAGDNMVRRRDSLVREKRNKGHIKYHKKPYRIQLAPITNLKHNPSNDKIISSLQITW